MDGVFQGYVVAGRAGIDGLDALPKVNSAWLLDVFERGRLPWSRVWQFVVLGHWLEENFLEQRFLPDSRERATST
jgi:hypothetical protein